MEINRISFVGLGLIGGSIAKAIKKKYPDILLYATARNESTIQMAYEAKVIENNQKLSYEEIAKSQIIFLCSPVETNIEYLKQLKPYLDKSTIITDVGSVKGNIQKAVDELGLCEQFVGGHPMAGSEKTGFEYSDDNILKGAVYVFTSENKALESFIGGLGVNVVHIEPKSHDSAVACVSHLPHVVSSALVHTSINVEDDDSILRQVAAGGYKDMTRIAASSPEVWVQICMSNKKSLLSLIEKCEHVLCEFKDNLEADNETELYNYFKKAKDHRDGMNL